MFTRFPRTTATKLSDLLLDDFLVANLKQMIQNLTQPETVDGSKFFIRIANLCEKFPSKTIIGLHEPIFNSNLLPEGFYLSQNMSIEPKKGRSGFVFLQNVLNLVPSTVKI